MNICESLRELIGLQDSITHLNERGAWAVIDRERMARLQKDRAALMAEIAREFGSIKAGTGLGERTYTRDEIDYFINLAGAVEVQLEPLVTAQPGDEVDEDGRLPLAVIVEKVAEYVRRDARNTLHLLMTNFSEEAYCAGWMHGLEQACKDIVADKLHSYGQLEGEEFDTWKRDLIKYHDLAGGWWEWSDEAHWEVFVPDVLEADHD